MATWLLYGQAVHVPALLYVPPRQDPAMSPGLFEMVATEPEM